jgi:hypothetical protein
VLGIYEREKLGANLMFGSFYFESLTLVRRFRTGESRSPESLHYLLTFLVAVCDYTLIGRDPT